MWPIWKDYYIQFVSALDSNPYSIQYDDETIYSGIAYRNPKDGWVTIKVNDILLGYFNDSYIAKTFTFVYDGHTEAMTFVKDLSYETDSVSDGLLSRPIDGRIDVTLTLPMTSIGATRVGVLTPDGETGIIVSGALDRRTVWIEPQGSTYRGPAIMRAANRSGIMPGDIPVTVVDACARYALYYTNPFGGWDYLLMGGEPTTGDTYDRKTYVADYDNSDTKARAAVNYASDWSRRWMLRTGWLTEEQSGRMHYLLGSTNVMIYDRTTGTFEPVTLATSDSDRKTYKGGGRQLIQYAIECVSARNRQRR